MENDVVKLVLSVCVTLQMYLIQIALQNIIDSEIINACLNCF